MGKMNESTYEALYVYGKKVFNNEMNAGEAAKVVNQSNPEVALSSAEHYINWYSRMRAGDFLSWNTNAELLKYYVTKVFEEETLADAAKAILAARKYVDCVTNACDAGREGELIFRLVYDKAKCKKPIKRLWISSMEDEAIINGFENLRDGKEYEALYEAALCRERADWIVGINATRLFSTLYGQTLNV